MKLRRHGLRTAKKMGLTQTFRVRVIVFSSETWRRIFQELGRKCLGERLWLQPLQRTAIAPPNNIVSRLDSIHSAGESSGDNNNPRLPSGVPPVRRLDSGSLKLLCRVRILLREIDWPSSLKCFIRISRFRLSNWPRADSDSGLRRRLSGGGDDSRKRHREVPP